MKLKVDMEPIVADARLQRWLRRIGITGVKSCLVIALLFPIKVIAGPPPSDPSVDWLMQSATIAPATRPASIAPATRPAVLSTDDEADARPGVITLSDGKALAGPITTTAERPIRVWVDDDKSYHDIPFDSICSIEAVVLWERDEKEWTFKATGSDEKVYSGKTYPARETQYRFTLDDKSVVTGATAAPLYVHADGRDITLVLHKRDKGSVGQTLDDLVYVRTVKFDSAVAGK